MVTQNAGSGTAIGGAEVAVALPLAPLVRAGGTRRYPEPTEHVQHGPVGNTEVFADRSQRLTCRVHVPGDRDVFVAEDAIPRPHFGASQHAEDGGAVDTEILGEVRSWFPG